MAFLSSEKLLEMGFRSLGRDVLVSDKASIYNADQISIGDYSRIDDFCVLSGRISIGRNVHIAIFNNVAGGTEGVTLDDFSGLAYGCHVFSQSDDYTGTTMTNPTVPAEYKNVTRRRVRIGRHCILGTGTIVFPGVDVAEGTATSASAVVKRATEPWSIYAGDPARKVKARKKDLLALEKKYLLNAG